MSEAAHEVALRLASSSPSPGPEARQLVAHVLGVEVSRLIAAPPPTPDQRAEIDRLVARLGGGDARLMAAGRAALAQLPGAPSA